MELVLSWHVDADTDIDRALMYDKAEEAARIAQGVEAGNRILESWVLRSHGRMLGEAAGVSGSAQLSAEYLEELPDIVRQVEEATNARMHVGVGAEPSEAVVARKVAEERGGDPAIVLYTPDLSKEARDLDEMSDEEADALDEPVDDDGGAGGFDAGAAAAAAPAGGSGMAKAENQREGGEATQVQQGKLSPTAAAPSPPPSPGPSSASVSASPGGQQPPQGAPQGGGEPDDEEVLGAVGSVLKQFQAQLPFFEQQVKQANPQAYQTVVGMMKAMVAMAQAMAGGDAGAEPPPDAGGGQSPQQMQKSALEKGDVTHLFEREHECPKCGSTDTEYRATRAKNRDHDRMCVGCKNTFNSAKQPLPEGPAAPRAPEGSREHLKVVKAEASKVEDDGSGRRFLNEEELRKRGETDMSPEASKEHSEHPWTTPEEAERIAADHQRLGKDEPAPTRHNVVLPVGSRGVGNRARSVKVLEPVTGKVSWHQVSVGQKLSGDNHPLSPRVGECPSADSPERRAQQAGLVGQQSASKPGQTPEE